MSKRENSGATPAVNDLPTQVVGVLRLAAICLGLGILFAWFGIYQTSAFPFPERVAYWTLLMALGTGASFVVNPLVFDRWLPGAHPALQIALVSALISIPVTGGLVVMEASSEGTWPSPSWWWQHYFYVIVLSAFVTTGAWGIDLLRDKRAPVLPQASAPQAVARADRELSSQGAVGAENRQLTPFVDRLPVKLRAAEIHAVSAEDHYLRVHTNLGETMVLMRLADAIRELGALEGMQTHRSWWVARQGLADAAKGDGKVTLKLKSGAEAPVSRTYIKAVRDAGWL